MHRNVRSPDPALQIPLPILLWATGVWWVIALDGRRARLFVRKGRNGDFVESDLLTHDSAGDPIKPVESGHHHGRYEKTERQFVERIARQIEQLAGEGAFDHLAIFAAPTALGVLREAMGSMTASRLRFSQAADIVGEPARRVLERLEARG